MKYSTIYQDGKVYHVFCSSEDAHTALETSHENGGWFIGSYGQFENALWQSV